ncbi:MAG: efflux family protein [Haloplasmataceae bacterium]|jgi:putative MATE family efflux protein|nr:efflux family protein [Haloplasmataceae bacterium]
MSNAHHRLLGEEKIYKLLIKFSVPGIFGMVINSLYNIVDRIFVGQTVGPDGIAGISASFPLMIIFMAFAMLIGMGTTSLVSIRLGQHRQDDAEKIIGNSLTLLITVSIVLSIIAYIFVEPILSFMGAKREILPLAVEYSKIIIIGNVFQFLSFGMNHNIRAQGKPKTAMATMLIGAITNIILDYFFVITLDMGMAGAAIATIISQAVSAFWVISFFYSKKSTLRIHLKFLKLKKEIVYSIITIGMAPFLLQLASSVMQIILNKSIAYYGEFSPVGYENAQAAIGIVNSVATLLLMPLIGINQGVQPIIGYNYGAEKYARVKEAMKLGLMAATTIVTITFIFSRIFPEQLVKMFIPEDKLTTELLQFSIRAINIQFLAIPIVGFQILGSSYFQATGRPLYAAFLSLTRQIIFLIPLLLILPLSLGLEGILYSIPLADVLSTIVTTIFVVTEFKKLTKREQQIKERELLNN